MVGAFLAWITLSRWLTHGALVAEASVGSAQGGAATPFYQPPPLFVRAAAAACLLALVALRLAHSPSRAATAFRKLVACGARAAAATAGKEGPAGRARGESVAGSRTSSAGGPGSAPYAGSAPALGAGALPAYSCDSATTDFEETEAGGDSDVGAAADGRRSHLRRGVASATTGRSLSLTRSPSSSSDNLMTSGVEDTATSSSGNNKDGSGVGAGGGRRGAYSSSGGESGLRSSAASASDADARTFSASSYGAGASGSAAYAVTFKLADTARNVLGLAFGGAAVGNGGRVRYNDDHHQHGGATAEHAGLIDGGGRDADSSGSDVERGVGRGARLRAHGAAVRPATHLLPFAGVSPRLRSASTRNMMPGGPGAGTGMPSPLLRSHSAGDGGGGGVAAFVAAVGARSPPGSRPRSLNGPIAPLSLTDLPPPRARRGTTGSGRKYSVTGGRGGSSTAPSTPIAMAADGPADAGVTGSALSILRRLGGGV